MTFDAIVTVPPYAPFIKEVARHPIVSGVRLNTVMPTHEPLDELVGRLADITEEKKLWIDLKGRQLRVVDYWVPPFTGIKVSHPVKAQVPLQAYFSDGNEAATVVGIKEDTLIMLEGPKRVVGPGESINLIGEKITIDGYLTDTDKHYLEAAAKNNVDTIMTSFVEQDSDVDCIGQYINNPSIIAKIESQKGLVYCGNKMKNNVRLMAARGDLYVEVNRPHEIIQAMHTIVNADSSAVIGSRLMSSLAKKRVPDCQDITDVYNAMQMGYRTFMFGDDLCFERDAIIGALNLFESIGKSYMEGRKK